MSFFLESLQTTGKILHVNNYMWSVMKKSSVSRMQKVYVFPDSVLCLGKMNQNPTSNAVWEEKWSWFKCSQEYRALDTIDGEPLEFEWNIFPGFTTLQLINKVHEFMTKMGDPSQFKGSEDNERECNANATLVSLFAKRFPTRT